LACECRADDLDTARALAAFLNDTRVRAAVTAERALLAALEAGCSAPVGALADVVEDLGDDGRVGLRLSLRGVAATADGDLLRSSATGKLSDAENLGRHVAAELLDVGVSSASETTSSSPGEALRQDVDQPPADDLRNSNPCISSVCRIPLLTYPPSSNTHAGSALLTPSGPAPRHR
jgi:hypothetical protein